MSLKTQLYWYTVRPTVHANPEKLSTGNGTFRKISSKKRFWPNVREKSQTTTVHRKSLPPPPPPPPHLHTKKRAPCSNYSLFLFHVFGNFMTSEVSGTQLSWAIFLVEKAQKTVLNRNLIIDNIWKNDAKFYLVNAFKVERWTIYDERYLKPKQNAQLLYQSPAHLFVPPSSLVHCS